MAVGQDVVTVKNEGDANAGDNEDGEHHRENIEEEATEKLLKNGVKSLNVDETAEQNCTVTEDINKFLREMPLTDDVTCGFWIFKGKFFQR